METQLVESQACRRRGKRTRAKHIPCRNVSMTPRNIQMAAMDSPVFDYVVFYFLLKLHLIEETLVSQKKFAHYQSGTQFSIKTLSSTNVWLTWITCMVAVKALLSMGSTPSSLLMDERIRYSCLLYRKIVLLGLNLLALWPNKLSDGGVYANCLSSTHCAVFSV